MVNSLFTYEILLPISLWGWSHSFDYHLRTIKGRRHQEAKWLEWVARSASQGWLIPMMMMRSSKWFLAPSQACSWIGIAYCLTQDKFDCLKSILTLSITWIWIQKGCGPTEDAIWVFSLSAEIWSVCRERDQLTPNSVVLIHSFWPLTWIEMSLLDYTWIIERLQLKMNENKSIPRKWLRGRKRRRTERLNQSGWNLLEANI